MATMTSDALTTSDANLQYTISVTQKSQNIPANNSTVSVSVNFYRTDSGSTSGSGTLYCKIDGTTYMAAITSSQKITSSGIVLYSTTVTIPHEDDGTKSLSVTAWIDHSKVTSSEQGFRVALSDIGRKSTLTVSDGTLGTVQTITVNRKVDTYTHTITYKCGTASGTICANSTDTSISWSPPISLASQTTTGSSVSVTLTIETFYNGDSLGTSAKTINCALPGNALAPVVSVTISDAMGYKDTYGNYVQAQSKLKVNVSATGQQGATVESCKMSFESGEYWEWPEEESKTTLAAEFTTGVIKGSGSLTVTIVVTDSRNQSTTVSESVSVYAYTVPTISEITSYRSNSSGTSSTSGAYLTVKFSAQVSALDNQNTASYKVEYKKVSASSYSTKTLTSYNGAYAVTNGVGTFSASTDSSYDIVLTVTDAFTSTSRSVNGSSQNYLWSIKSGSTGIAIGKLAESDDIFDVNWKINARKGITVPKSGWLYATLSSSFVAADSNTANRPCYQKDLNVVTVRGQVQTAAQLSYLANTTIATGIASGYRPPADVYFLCPTLGVNHWVCTITTAGEIKARLYGSSDTLPEAIPQGTYLLFCCTYQL